ncbi:MAG: DivIVA domain-containing protein [Oscillospiraceae bacterium]|nr:DivIVA domain-containing protein [Oscillospiraceae bacterium]
MLTPQEITDKVFVKAVFGGYDMTGVDDFLESLSADYSALYKENAILKGKLKVLVEKVEEYRSTEDAMRMALLTAQKMGEEITVEANKQKEETLKIADQEASAVLAQVTHRVADEEAKLVIASKETAKFIALSQAIMQKHSEFLSKLETARRAVAPEIKGVPGAAAPQQASYEYTRSNAQDEQPTEAPPEGVSDEALDDDVQIYGEDGQAAEADGQEAASSISPRPKFDFDDLQFGANFDNKK